MHSSVLVEPELRIRPDDDIVVTKWIALAGTARLCDWKRDELRGYFPEWFIRTAAEFSVHQSTEREERFAEENGIRAVHPAGRGGIFGALWEFADASGVGLVIELKQIPIRQETVEICNFLDVNPYQLDAGGSLLLATTDGYGMVARLAALGIPAAVIGKATAVCDRVIVNKESRRFLEPPRREESERMAPKTCDSESRNGR